jgi:thiol-disulfide isomerase/thioredoxin
MSWIFILFSLIIVAILLALYFYNMGVNFGFPLRQGFQSGGKNTFTMYYADWCGHCQTAKPGFTEFMKKGTIDVGGTSCEIRMISPEKNPEAVQGKTLKGYPTFLLETVDGNTVEYTGDRSVDGYMSFLTTNLGAKTSS